MPGSECCEHCAAIPLLREEIAALRARLNALTTVPLSASDPLPLQAELDVAAKTPPRQMPLFGVGEEKRSRRPRPRPPAPRDLGSVPRRASSVTAHSSCEWRV